MTDDNRWLVEFVEDGSQEAFGRIVDRHIDLVYAAALRDVRDRHHAEDVTQAAFLALARKAKVLRQEHVLTAWWAMPRSRRASAAVALSTVFRTSGARHPFSTMWDKSSIGK